MADSILVGFMGQAVVGVTNLTSCATIPERAIWPALELAPSLEETMRRAAEIESRHLRADWSDRNEAHALAQESEQSSRQWLFERGYLP